MKSWIAVYLLITATMAFCFTAQTTTDIPSISDPFHKDKSINTRHLTRKLSPSMSKAEDKDPTIKAVEKMMTRHNQGLAENEDSNEDGLIYNVDYHGVTTHPSPYPRHPKP